MTNNAIFFRQKRCHQKREKTRPPISPDASLQAALGAFEIHMRDKGFAINTVKAFASDVRLLGKYIGIGQPVGGMGTKNLTDFLDWLLNERIRLLEP